MNKLFFGLILLLSPLAFAQQCKKLVAYGNPDYPPYIWRAEKGLSMTGANVDVLNLISKEIDIPIEVRYGGTWARVQEEARHGRVDIIAGAFMTTQRKGYIDYFLQPLGQTRTDIWVREKNKIKFKSWTDLIGLRGVTVINNSSGEKFDKFAKESLNIVPVTSLQQAFDMLTKGRVHYLLYEEWPARAFISKNKISGVLSLRPAIAEEMLYLAISKRSPCNRADVKEKMNVALKKISQLNVMGELLKKHALYWENGPRVR